MRTQPAKSRGVRPGVGRRAGLALALAIPTVPFGAPPAGAVEAAVEVAAAPGASAGPREPTPRPPPAAPPPADAMASAVRAYRDGDFRRSLALLAPLAEAGSARAQTILGIMHAYGEGTPPDLPTAARWYERAAEQGYAPAQYNLALLYLDDPDAGAAPPDGEVRRRRALDWLRRAAAHGLQSAVTRLRELDPNAYAEVTTSPPLTRATRRPAATAAHAEPAPPAQPDAGKRYAVQLMASRSEPELRRAWGRYRSRHHELLDPYEARLTRVDLGPERGVWYRLRVGPFASLDQAEALCAALQAQDAAPGAPPSCLALRLAATDAALTSRPPSSSGNGGS